MFSSSWSMLLFTFLLGMLVIRLFWKKETFSRGASSSRSSALHGSLLPQSMLPQQLLSQHSPFCLLYHFYTLSTFIQAEDNKREKWRKRGPSPRGELFSIKSARRRLINIKIMWNTTSLSTNLTATLMLSLLSLKYIIREYRFLSE